MDDDIVSLIGLILIVNPSFRKDQPYSASLNQLPLSLYLMTQCQIKLHHPVTSLSRTLDYATVARRDLADYCVLDKLLSQLTERKILLYICRELADLSL